MFKISKPHKGQGCWLNTAISHREQVAALSIWTGPIPDKAPETFLFSLLSNSCVILTPSVIGKFGGLLFLGMSENNSDEIEIENLISSLGQKQIPSVSLYSGWPWELAFSGVNWQASYLSGPTQRGKSLPTISVCSIEHLLAWNSSN